MKPHSFVVVMVTSPRLHEKDREVCINTRSPPAWLPACLKIWALLTYVALQTVALCDDTALRFFIFPVMHFPTAIHVTNTPSKSMSVFESRLPHIEYTVPWVCNYFYYGTCVADQCVLRLKGTTFWRENVETSVSLNDFKQASIKLKMAMKLFCSGKIRHEEQSTVCFPSDKITCYIPTDILGIFWCTKRN